MSIPLIKPLVPKYEDLEEIFREILTSGKLTNEGKYVKEYRKKLTEYFGLNCAVVNNATIGLILAIKAMGLKGNVITPSYTFCATAHSLVWNNIEPRFVDIDPETFNIDVNKIEEAIDDNTSAILAVNVYGNPCDIDALLKICKKHNLKLIFDSAHAIGSLYKNKSIIEFGDVHVFSTHATKSLITGEGGIITCANNKLFERIVKGINFGFENQGSDDCRFVGLNAKMPDLSAAIGIKSLELLPANLVSRNRIYEKYVSLLKDVKGLVFQKLNSDAKCSHLYMPILIDPDVFGMNRDQVADKLAQKEIGTRKYFSTPVHKFTCYNLDISLPITEYVSDNILSLPMYSDMTNNDIEYVCSEIRNLLL